MRLTSTFGLLLFSGLIFANLAVHLPDCRGLAEENMRRKADALKLHVQAWELSKSRKTGHSDEYDQLAKR